MEQLTVSALLQGIVLISAALAGAVASVKLILRGVDSRAQRVAADLDKALDAKLDAQSATIRSELSAALEPIKQELRPNGGASLADKVIEVKTSIDALAQEKRSEHQSMHDRHEENANQLAALAASHHALRRGLLTYLKLRRRQSTGQGDAGDTALALEAMEDLERLDEDQGRRHRPGR